MGASSELFAHLKTGPNAVLEQLRSSTPEHDLLDFKQVATRPDLLPTKLAKDDLSNLGRSVAGFSNSMGGVVVWGVKCDERIPSRDRELAPGIEQPKPFAAALQSHLSGATIPSAMGVEFATVDIDDCRSMVLMHVPRHPGRPIRTEVGHREDKGRYHMRAGESFVSIPHEQLALMFGRVPGADLRPKWGQANGDRKVGVGDSIVLPLEVTMMNVGAGMTLFPYANVSATTPGVNSRLLSEPRDTVRFIMHQDLAGAIWTGRDGHPLPPQAVAFPGAITLELAPPFTRNLRLTLAAGGASAPRYPIRLTTSPDRLEDVHRRRDELTVHEAWSILFTDSVEPKESD